MLKFLRLKYLAAALVMTGLVTPQAARADLHQAVGAVLMICLLNPNACGGNGGKKGGGGGGGGAAHEVAMDRQQKMYVQQGLASLGVYSGAIDGAFGRQTAASISQYQRAIGHAANGRLTKPQVTDLMARAPRFRDLPSDSPQFFEIEFVRVPRPDLAQVQQQLNMLGYNAGTPDGVFGNRTRNAIAAYKRDYGLAGPPEATARLLARLRGDSPPPFALMAIIAPEFVPGYRPPAVIARADGGGGGAAGVRGVTDPTLPVKADAPAVVEKDQGTLTELAAKVEDEPEVLPDTPVIVEVSDLDILSMRTGITQDAALAIAKEELPNGYFQETATAESMGGDKIHSFGLHIAEAGFPEAFTNRLTLIYDEAFPDLGAMAIFREVALPEGLTLEQIERDIVPRAVESYGMESRFGDKLIWVSDGEARGEIGTDLVLLDECGSYQMDYSQRGADGSDTWETGGGPQLMRESLTSVVRGCGDVLAITYTERSITFALWNTDMILDQMAIMGTPPAKDKGGLAGKIKF